MPWEESVRGTRFSALLVNIALWLTHFTSHTMAWCNFCSLVIMCQRKGGCDGVRAISTSIVGNAQVVESCALRLQQNRLAFNTPHYSPTARVWRNSKARYSQMVLCVAKSSAVSRQKNQHAETNTILLWRTWKHHCDGHRSLFWIKSKLNFWHLCFRSKCIFTKILNYKVFDIFKLPLE